MNFNEAKIQWWLTVLIEGFSLAKLTNMTMT